MFFMNVVKYLKGKGDTKQLFRLQQLLNIEINRIFKLERKSPQ